MIWPMIAGGLISAVSAWHGADQMSNTMGEVETHLKPWRDSIDDYKTTSDEYMSIGSQVNQDMRTDIRQNALDFVASGNRMNQRNLSSGGLGGYSGLQGANSSQLYNKALANSEDMFQSAFTQNQKFGVSLLDSYIKNLRGYGETMAQGQIQSDSMKANMITQAGMGMGQGLMDFGLENLAQGA